MQSKIVIFSNDYFFEDEKNLYYQNKNTKTILEIISSKYKILLVSRNKLINKRLKVKKKNIERINFLSTINFILNNKNLKFFFISITPLNFLYYFFLKLILVEKKNIFLFLRSDGFKEYQIKKPIIGYLAYFIMFEIFNLGSKVLSCSKTFNRLKKFKILLPSELDKNWLNGQSKNKISKKIKILYVGRFKKEKGYLSLINIFDKMNKKIGKYDLNLTLVGYYKNLFFKKKKISIIQQIDNDISLKKIFDNHQVFVLPSYTEGFPQVILESFARKKPVIVFKELSFLKKVYPNGLFISERNEMSFRHTLSYILSNYNKIVKKINLIPLVTKKNYKINLLKIINY